MFVVALLHSWSFAVIKPLLLSLGRLWDTVAGPFHPLLVHRMPVRSILPVPFTINLHNSLVYVYSSTREKGRRGAGFELIQLGNLSRLDNNRGNLCWSALGVPKSRDYAGWCVLEPHWQVKILCMQSHLEAVS